jgi:zinc transport system ATP-binding protein
VNAKACVLGAEDVTVRYGATTALDGVSLRVENGEFVGLVGPNGSGKSTLVRTLLGLVEPDEGQTCCCGRPIHRFEDWSRVGYVPQDAVHVDPKFPASVLEVALLGRVAERGLVNRWTDEDREAAHAALERVGIGHLADRSIGTLSGGERQRAFLAKALASDPDLLLLDEPMAGVDAAAREDFYNLVDDLNHAEGLTILLVSHDLPAVRMCCHRLVALNQRVVFDGSPRDFEDEGGLSDAYDMHVSHHPDRPEGRL